MTKQHAFTREDLLRCSRGELFGPGNAQLPAPNMLMVDRIVHISEVGGKYGKGELVAELISTLISGSSLATSKAIRSCPAAWVSMPCGSWSASTSAGRGNPGRGRTGFWRSQVLRPVLPTAKKVTYNIHIKRTINRSLILGIADGTVSVDGREIYSAEGLRVGLFTSTDSF